MKVAALRVGFFGKLPARGDFVRFSVSSQIVDTFDGWLQVLMPAAESALGDCWSDVWRATMPWRFAATPGLCGPCQTTGVWFASRDRVGRKFPFVIAAEASYPHEAFLQAAEDLGIEAIKAQMTPGELTDRLRSLTHVNASDQPVTSSGSPAIICWWRQCGSARSESVRGDRLPNLATFIEMLSP